LPSERFRGKSNEYFRCASSGVQTCGVVQDGQAESRSSMVGKSGAALDFPLENGAIAKASRGKKQGQGGTLMGDLPWRAQARFRNLSWAFGKRVSEHGSPPSLSCYLFNARSLVNKLHHIQHFISITKPDIIFITETWLNPKVLDSEILFGCPYEIYRGDRRGARGGGVCCIVKSCLLVHTLKLNFSLKSDVLCMDVFSANTSYHLRFAVVYRPPKSLNFDDENLVALLTTLAAARRDTIVLVLGDFNLHIDWSDCASLHASSSNILKFFDDAGFTQLVNIPTFSNHILDLVFTTSPTVNGITTLSPLTTSDHKMLHFFVSFCCIPENHLVPWPNFSRVDYRSLNECLFKVDWLAVFDGYSSTFELYQRFCRVMYQHLSLFKKRLFETELSKATALGDFFASVFSKEESCSPNITLPPPSRHRMSNVYFHPAEVEKILKHLKPSITEPYDGIPSIVYKKCSASLCKPLAHIFNVSLMLCEVPEIWKDSIVTAIPKTSGASCVSDYRPISLTPPPIKVMEKIINEKLLSFINRLRLIPTEQHGFLYALNQGNSIDVVYIDLSKAFDKVSHYKLLQKLHFLGIDGNLLNWFASYLDERHMTVKVGRWFSERYHCTSGVPQGAVLSPLLFLIYTMELPSLLKVSPNSLKLLSAWATEMSLTVNLGKSFVLHYGDLPATQYEINGGFKLDYVRIRNRIERNRSFSISYCCGLQGGFIIYLAKC
uniref:Reverse transcriptase domain-containing protein n=1 Tax=Heligmosomoides polygyrus TaxID=6339 RepID=A0A183FNQ6_HELPZ